MFENARWLVVRALFLLKKTAIFEQCTWFMWSQIQLLNWKLKYLPDHTGTPSYQGLSVDSSIQLHYMPSLFVIQKSVCMCTFSKLSHWNSVGLVGWNRQNVSCRRVTKQLNHHSGEASKLEVQRRNKCCTGCPYWDDVKRRRNRRTPESLKFAIKMYGENKFPDCATAQNVL